MCKRVRERESGNLIIQMMKISFTLLRSPSQQTKCKHDEKERENLSEFDFVASLLRREKKHRKRGVATRMKSKE